MRKTNQRKFSLFLVLFLILPLVIGIAYADHGPKPSITINVTNGPQKYYIALLWETDVVNRDLEALRNSEEVRDNVALKTLVDYEEGGWMVHVPKVGSSYFWSTPSESYEFGYNVPKRFRVILVSEGGTVYLSEPIVKDRYNAVFSYKASSGEITELYTHSILKYVRNFLFCYILTLIVEGITLCCFGLSTRRNWVRFLIINTLTQLMLNASLILSDWNRGTGGIEFWGNYLCAEALILLIEAVYYAIVLRKKDGTKKTSRNIAYAITANLLSTAIGFFICLYLFIGF